MPIILLKMLSELDNLGLQLDCSCFFKSPLILSYPRLFAFLMLYRTISFVVSFHFIPSRPGLHRRSTFLMIKKKES